MTERKNAAPKRESALPTEPKYGSSSFWQPRVASSRLNDDATYNRSSLTPEQAMDIGMWDLAPRGRGDSMG